MKMSKSQAGKLGGEKSSIFSANLKKQNIEQYTLNPKHCKHCNLVLNYDSRFKIFCDSSCSASYNNVKRAKLKSPKHCLTCNHLISSKGKYCSIKCQMEYQYQHSVNNWLSGKKLPGKSLLKRYLTENYGYRCVSCGISKYNEKPITLEIEHKDGNSENSLPDNLCFLCPNCHSQTPTYKGRNKGKGRHSRRQRYKEGKSY